MNAPLICSVEVARGTFDLRIDLTVDPGEIVGVIGANGSGKSTLLGSIAGTLPIRSGRIALGDRTLSSREEGSRELSLPRAARRVGLLDQRARLFPHLDATANITFGPRAQGRSRSEADATAREWLERVGLAGRGAARENELSGGQQQRVAIARTLAAEPQALLLDEPFAALDVSSSSDLRVLLTQEIRRLDVPTVLVTHDPVDLIALADRVLVLEAGRVAQQGTVAEILAAPTTDFAAEFSGRTLLRGHATENGTLRVDGAPVPEIQGRQALAEPGRAAVGSFDPADVRIEAATSAASDSAPHSTGAAAFDSLIWIGTVSSLSSSRTGVRVECFEWPGFFAEVPVSRASEAWLQPGSHVRLEIPTESITLTSA